MVSAAILTQTLMSWTLEACVAALHRSQSFSAQAQNAKIVLVLCKYWQKITQSLQVEIVAHFPAILHLCLLLWGCHITSLANFPPFAKEFKKKKNLCMMFCSNSSFMQVMEHNSHNEHFWLACKLCTLTQIILRTFYSQSLFPWTVRFQNSLQIIMPQYVP